MEVMSLKSFIGGIHPKDQKQYTTCDHCVNYFFSWSRTKQMDSNNRNYMLDFVYNVFNFRHKKTNQ